jgi:hypothetical protein
MPTSVERLAAQLDALRNRMDAGFRTPQLTSSSIDNGSLPVKDGDGVTTVIIGQQFDGTAGAITVNEPTPPIPSGVTASTVLGGINVHWDGTFQDPQPGYTTPVHAPMTFNGVVVEVADNPAFNPSTTPVNKGVIASASGGDRQVAWPASNTTLYARLRTRGASGILSDPSLTVVATSGQVQLGDLGFDLHTFAGGTTIFYGSTTPTGTILTGDVWLQNTGTDPVSGKPKYTTWRWTGSAWVALIDQGISQALADALAAQTTANSATVLANAASSLAGSKITSFYQTTAPTSGMSTGDFWLDTDDGNKLYRYSGAAWLLVQDSAIQTALTNAGTAQATADRKVQIWAQVAAPTAGEVGDLWVDTDDGNKLYVWGPSTTVKRTNLTVNPGFQYDAVGTLAAAPAGWTTTFGGTTNTLTTSIDALGSVGGTNRGKIASSSMRNQTADWIGFQQTYTGIVSGDVFRIDAYAAWTVTQANHRLELLIEFLTAAGAVIGTATQVNGNTMGTAGSQTLNSGTVTAPATTASMRLSVRRRGILASAGTNTTNSDLMVDAVLVEKNRSSVAPTTYFDGNTTGTDHVWNGAQYLSTSSGWETPTSGGSNGWQPQTLRTGAFEPQALLASSIITTGSITAPLLEANMILTTTVIAGNPAADYAAMTPTGFRVYNSGDEVVRMGTDTNDYFAVIASNGTLSASIDDTGRASFAGLSVTGDPVFQGQSLTQKLSGYVGASPGRFSGFPPAQAVGSYGPIGDNRVGIAEVNGFLTAGRDYQISWIGTAMCDVDDSVETRVYLQYQGPTSSGSNTANAPNVSTSAEVDHWLHSFHAATRWETISGFGRFSCTTTGRHRFLLASERGGLGRTGATSTGDRNTASAWSSPTSARRVLRLASSRRPAVLSSRALRRLLLRPRRSSTTSRSTATRSSPTRAGARSAAIRPMLCRAGIHLDSTATATGSSRSTASRRSPELWIASMCGCTSTTGITTPVVRPSSTS